MQLILPLHRCSSAVAVISWVWPLLSSPNPVRPVPVYTSGTILRQVCCWWVMAGSSLDNALCFALRTSKESICTTFWSAARGFCDSKRRGKDHSVFYSVHTHLHFHYQRARPFWSDNNRLKLYCQNPIWFTSPGDLLRSSHLMISWPQHGFSWHLQPWVPVPRCSMVLPQLYCHTCSWSPAVSWISKPIWVRTEQIQLLPDRWKGSACNWCCFWRRSSFSHALN